MGNFYQHVTCSTVTGICYGGVLYAAGAPLPVTLLSAGACSAAGMFPDIDSDTSQSFRECLYFAAGIAGVATAMRLSDSALDNEIVTLAAAGVFLGVRFGVGHLIKQWTSHRGMVHSIPAAIIAGELAFLVFDGPLEWRIAKAMGVVLGFLSHLILDEVFSVDLRGMHIKKSFGTALKWRNPKNSAATSMVYTALIALGVLCVNEPQIAEQLNLNGQLAQTTQQEIIAQKEKLVPISEITQNDVAMTQVAAVAPVGSAPQRFLSAVITSIAKEVVSLNEVEATVAASVPITTVAAVPVAPVSVAPVATLTSAAPALPWMHRDTSQQYQQPQQQLAPPPLPFTPRGRTPASLQ